VKSQLCQCIGGVVATVESRQSSLSSQDPQEDPPRATWLPGSWKGVTFRETLPRHCVPGWWLRYQRQQRGGGGPPLCDPRRLHTPAHPNLPVAGKIALSVELWGSTNNNLREDATAYHATGRAKILLPGRGHRLSCKHASRKCNATMIPNSNGPQNLGVPCATKVRSYPVHSNPRFFSVRDMGYTLMSPVASDMGYVMLHIIP
jgi:hypothetical protein